MHKNDDYEVMIVGWGGINTTPTAKVVVRQNDPLIIRITDGDADNVYVDVLIKSKYPLQKMNVNDVGTKIYDDGVYRIISGPYNPPVRPDVIPEVIDS